MSLGAVVGPMPWGDGEHVFRLGIGELAKVQAKCDAGPGVIAHRLFSLARALEAGLTVREAVQTGMIGDWRVDDVREPILQGLVGMGMSPVDAAVLVRSHIDHKGGIAKHVPLAYAIVMASIEGVEDEPLGEGEAGKPARRRSRTARSASPSSTATARPSGGRRGKSTS